MSFSVPLWHSTHWFNLGTLFHVFAPYLLWCFSVSDPCNLSLLKFLRPHTLFQKPWRTFAAGPGGYGLGYVFDCESSIWYDFVGAFSAFLTLLRKRHFLSRMHGPNAPKRPSNHSTSASPCACAVQMPHFQPFRPSARARLEATKDKTLSPVKATLEEAPHDPDPPHSA